MDYEKAYKDLIGGINSMINKGAFNEEQKTQLNTMILELTEFEDERIRLFIRDLLTDLVWRKDWDVSKDECRTWLENQKDEEGYEAIPIESTLEYKLGFKAGKKSEKQKERKPEIPLMNGDTDTYFDSLRMIIKPLTSREWFDEGIKYAQKLQKEQKPVEWSEEDEKMLEAIKSYIHYGHTGNISTNIGNILIWLKSLKNRWNFPKSNTNSPNE